MNNKIFKFLILFTFNILLAQKISNQDLLEFQSTTPGYYVYINNNLSQIMMLTEEIDQISLNKDNNQTIISNRVNFAKCKDRIRKGHKTILIQDAINTLNEISEYIENIRKNNIQDIAGEKFNDLFDKICKFSKEIEENQITVQPEDLIDAINQTENQIIEGKTRVPPTITPGSSLGDLTFKGFDGTNYSPGAQIEAIAENTISAGSVPSHLEISVTPDGSTLAEKVRIFSTGSVAIDGGLHIGAITDPGNDNLTVDGTVTLSALGQGVVKSNSSGVLSSALITDADIDLAANISDTKLATITTAGKVANSATTATSSNAPNTIVLRDGSGNFSTNMITLAGTTTNATDAATKSYVDSVAQGLQVKAPVRVLSDSNQTISGIPGSPIDGVTMVANDRILLNGQTNAVENGIWIIQAGAWTRPADFDTGSSASGAFVFVDQGTVYKDTGWVCTTDKPNDVVGTNNLNFSQFSDIGAVTVTNVGAGTGQIFRDQTGNNINLRTLLAGNFITVTNNTNDITIAANGQSTNTINTLVARDASGNFAASDITITGATIQDATPANTQVRIGNPTVLGSNEGMLSVAGKVNIGITENEDAANLLNVGGRISATGFDTISDARFKKNQKNIDPEESLEIIYQLQPKTYEFNEEAKEKFKLEDGVQRGLIAQEVKEVLPEIVITDALNLTKSDKSTLHKLNYLGIIPDLIGAIKACKDEIESLKKELNELKK